MTLKEFGELVHRSLSQFPSFEIRGLGTFQHDETGDISFRHSTRARIFIAYAKEDAASAERLFRDLSARGFAAWLDSRNLLPGEDWPQRIEDAIAGSDFFIACFSNRSVKKRGGFQTEIRHALHFADSVPLDEVYFIPVRLDNCTVPRRIQREIQYVDLFPDWDEGFHRVLQIIEARQPVAA